MIEFTDVLGVSAAHLRALVERIESQLNYAEKLCAWHPANAAAWRRLIAKAQAVATAAIQRGDLQALRTAASECESILQPMAATAKKYTIYCAGHAHIDMNWMWSWPETVAITHDTFQTVIRLMEEFPEFRFSQSQASVYQIIQEHNPQLLKCISEKVKSGQWEVTASHWVEGDKNMISGDSLVRHLQVTRRYMAELFGLKAEDVQVDWSPDTFGHPCTMPMYLARGGVRYTYLHRPGAYHPEAFWWEAPDGSRVLVRNDQKRGYNGVLQPDKNMMGSLYDFHEDTGLPYTLFMYGVGDHGGGPTRRDLLRGREMATWPIFPAIKMATVHAFFRRLESDSAKLPVRTSELNTELAGCYTTQTLIKRSNRIAENRLMDAEAASVLGARLAGFDYPSAKLEEAWRDTLFGHFHDILPGSNVHDSRTYAHGLFQKTIATTSMIEARALRQIAAGVDTQAVAGETPTSELPPTRQITSLGSGVGFAADRWLVSASDQSAGEGPKPFVVFNPVAWERQELVEATIWFDSHVWQVSEEMRKRPWRVKLPDGRSIAAQSIDTGMYWNHGYTRVLFPVSAPSLGYTTVAIEEGNAEALVKDVRHLSGAHHCAYLRHEREILGMENDVVGLELDPATGGISRLWLKSSGIDLIRCEQAKPLLEYGVERSHGMSAWLIDHTGPIEYPQLLKVEKKLNGPYAVSLDLRYRIHESEITLTLELRSGEAMVYVHFNGTWFQRGSPETGIPSLRLALPLALAQAKATYEIPFGALERDHNGDQEQPALNWVRAEGLAGKKPAGIVLLNDCKHGHALDGSTLRMTLIRSSYEPDPLPEIGKHEIHLAIAPFAGAMDDGQCCRLGGAFNRPLRAVSTSIHSGDLPVEYAGLKVLPQSLVVTSVRQSAEGMVVYVQNTSDKPAEAKLSVNGRAIAAKAVDLLDRPANGKKAMTVPKRGIAAFLCPVEKS